MPRPLDAAKLANAIRLYESGKTFRESASIAGIGASTLYRILCEQGIFENRRMIPTPAGLMEDYLSGMSVKACAAKYGLARSAVYRMLGEAGINGRDRAEAMQLRWQRASAAQRRNMLDAAHAATRGRIVSDEERGRVAAGKNGKTRSAYEIALGAMLADLGYDVAYGIPCGKYNIDVTVRETVAVEVFGGQWHAHGHHRATFAERSRHILDAGYSLAIVWANKASYPISVLCAQHLGTLAEITCGHPSIGRQHWVIRGDGHFLAIREDDGDEVPFILPSGSRSR